jgi:Xaa-Pro aminopeptidase
MNYPRRLRATEDLLAQQKIDGMLVTHLPNIRYLCGFTGSSGLMAFARGEWAFFSDGRYIAQAGEQVKGVPVRINAQPPLIHAMQWLARRAPRAASKVRLGVEGEWISMAVSARAASELQRASRKTCRVVALPALVDELRMVKEADEIDSIRNAVRLASSLFPKLADSVREGAIENQLAGDLDRLARRAGAEKMAFESIVASGPRSAMPHARPGNERIGRGFVILDYGVILGGYCSDMTRTVYCGRITSREREMYEAVLEAQLAGIAAVSPGAKAGEVDAAARRLLRRRKLEKYFTHSLGHGLGLEIHEAPRLGRGQQTELKPGMTITIEPGVYIPGSGGVRIEDTVLVTASGCEVLTPTPKELVTR